MKFCLPWPGCPCACMDCTMLQGINSNITHSTSTHSTTQNTEYNSAECGGCGVRGCARTSLRAPSSPPRRALIGRPKPRPFCRHHGSSLLPRLLVWRHAARPLERVIRPRRDVWRLTTIITPLLCTVLWYWHSVENGLERCFRRNNFFCINDRQDQPSRKLKHLTSLKTKEILQMPDLIVYLLH